MDAQHYLIFTLSSSRYGITASAVQELFFLPEITLIAEAPSDIIGVINLRNEILPVVDLHRRLGRRSPAYKTTDSIIVLQTASQRIGILVSQVEEVQAISHSQLDPVSTGWGQGRSTLPAYQQFILGIAKLEDGIVTLLNPESLTQSVDYLPPAIANSEATLFHSSTSEIEEFDRSDRANLFRHFSPEAQLLLRQRADNLRQTTQAEDASGRTPLAVVGMGGEYFGLNLEVVHEFSDVSKVTPVPCCPAHIIGNMNLRGEIVTLVDIRHLINLSVAGENRQKKVIIVRQEQLVAGITVDDIFDVIYVQSSQLTTAPVAIHSASDEYLQGVASYQNKMMSVINLPRILSSGVLAVNEEV